MDPSSIALFGSVGTLLIGGVTAAIVKIIAALGDMKVQLIIAAMILTISAELRQSEEFQQNQRVQLMKDPY